MEEDITGSGHTFLTEERKEVIRGSAKKRGNLERLQ